MTAVEVIKSGATRQFEGQKAGVAFVGTLWERHGLATTRAHHLIQELSSALVKPAGVSRRFEATHEIHGKVTGITIGLTNKLAALEKYFDGSRASARNRSRDLETMEHFLAAIIGRSASIKKGNRFRPVPSTMQDYVREKVARAFAAYIIREAKSPELISRLSDIVGSCCLRPHCKRHLIKHLTENRMTSPDCMILLSKRLSDNSCNHASIVAAVTRLAELLVGVSAGIKNAEVESLKHTAGETFMMIARSRAEQLQTMVIVADTLGNAEARSVLAKFAEASAIRLRPLSYAIPHRPKSSLGTARGKRR